MLFLLGCGNVDKSKSLKVFRYNEDVSVTTLDPAFVKSQSEIWIVNQLYSGLIRLDDSLLPRANIAKTWDVSEDKLTYTFHLRTDVFFHKVSGLNGGKGQKVTAKDFVFSFNRVLNPSTASPGAWVFNDKVLRPENYSNLSDKSAPFVAIDDSTFQVKLTKPFPPFLSLLAMPYCYVVPHNLNQAKSLRNNPIGSGPFQFKLWEDGVKLILRKHEAYFRKDEIYLDAVNIDFIQNKQVAFMNFIQGKYDFFNGIDGTFKDELLTTEGQLQFKYSNQFTLQTKPFLNTEYLGIILDANGNTMLNQKKVRQALNWAIDKRKMISTLRNGVGIPATGGFIPAGLPGNILSNGYQFDLNKAKNLLKESRYKDEPIIINTTKDYIDMCLFIKSQWEPLGINTRIQIHPAGFLRQLRNKRSIKVYRGSWIADYADAENYLSCFYSPNFSPKGPNYCHFKNNQFDSLYQVLLKTTGNERQLIYSKMDHILVDEAPIIFLYYDVSIRLIGKNISGLNNTPINVLNLHGVTVK